MGKATKVTLKTDLESDEVPQPMATQEPAADAATTVTEEHEEMDDVEEDMPEHHDIGAAFAHEEHDEGEDEHATEHAADEEEEEPTVASEVEASTATVEERVKKITEEVGKLASEAVVQPAAEVGRQSFMSLNDLIRNLRPGDAHPQIDIASDYSNTMRLGEPGAVIVESSRKVRNSQQVY